MTTYYILFERNHDPYGQKAVEVHTDLCDAEYAQLMRQQDRAESYNRSRAKSFKAGLAVAEQHTADNYKHDFSIQEVKS